MISVSYLKSIDLKDVTIKKIDESIADMIHVDLMDGLYTKDNNFNTNMVIDDLKNTLKPLDMHLMVKRPSKYIINLAKLHPEFITIHLDIDDNIKDVIELIKDYNIKVGIAVNPDQDISLIEEYLSMIDYVLIMSVYPGLGGQKFIPDVLSKIEYLQNKDVLIGIDGGINEDTIKYLNNYRVDNIISGSFICMSNDYNKNILILKNGY